MIYLFSEVLILGLERTVAWPQVGFYIGTAMNVLAKKRTQFFGASGGWVLVLTSVALVHMCQLGFATTGVGI